MKHRSSLIWKQSVYILIFFLITFFIGNVAQGQDRKIALQNIHLKEGERVEGIELVIKAGSFVGFDPLPMGWYLIIDNDPSQSTSIKGDARVGSAALERNDLFRLRIMAHKVEFGGRKFSISGRLIVVSKNFESERHIVLRAENFKIIESFK